MTTQPAEGKLQMASEITLSAADKAHLKKHRTLPPRDPTAPLDASAERERNLAAREYLAGHPKSTGVPLASFVAMSLILALIAGFFIVLTAANVNEIDEQASLLSSIQRELDR